MSLLRPERAGNATRRRHLVPLLLLCTACSDLFEAERRPGFTFTGGGVADTIEAVLARPVTVQLRDAQKRVLAGARIQLSWRGLTAATTAAGLSAGSSGLLLDLDATGRGTIFVRLGTTAGDAWLWAQSVGVNPVFADSVSFQVLPGAAVSVVPEPADTAVRIGSTYAASLRAADRYRNARTEAIPGVIYRSLSPNLTVAQNGTVAAAALGRAAIELRSQNSVDTARVSVVPSGTLAVIAERGLHLLDLDGANARALTTGVAQPASPDWAVDGSGVLIAGLRIVGVAGQPVQLETGMPNMIPEAGVFSADGEWVYFTARRNTDRIGASQIWRIRTSGTGLEQISPSVRTFTAYGATPSPDGTRIAYIQIDTVDFTASRARLVVRTLATGQELIVANSLALGAPRWSPTGEWIAYTFTTALIVAVVDGKSVLGQVARVVSADGTQSRDLLAVGSSDPASAFLGGVSWSRDGQWLIGKAFHPDLRLTLVRFATGERLPLNRSTVRYSQPAWKP